MAFADLEAHVDLSIVRTVGVFDEIPPGIQEPLYLWNYRSPTVRAKSAFWGILARNQRWPEIRDDWATRGVTIATTVFEVREVELITEEQVESLQSFATNHQDVKSVDVPWSFTELMTECVPQFSLRNIPRAERYVDLALPMSFRVEDPVLPEINQEIADMRAVRIPRPDYIQFWSAPLVDDFRVFLEEVLYLCPWDQMSTPRQPPPDDSLWSSNHSRADLTFELFARKDILLVFDRTGRGREVSRVRHKRVARIVNANLPEADADAEPMG